MATLVKRGTGTPATSGTTWATVTNAVDGAVGTNPATYATMTNAVASATAYIEVTNYDFTAIGDGDTLNSVTATLRHFENNTGRFVSVTLQAYVAGSPVGTAKTCTLATAARDDTTVAFPITVAQLKTAANLKIRATVVGAASTQSRVFSVDHIDVTADYTPLPPTLTQAAYRLYADGTETGATALAGQDTGHTADLTSGDVNLQVRVRLQSTNTAAVAATDDFQLQWEKNTSGTWVNAGVGPVVLDGSWTTHSSTSFLGAADPVNAVGQSFVSGGGKLTSAEFTLAKFGAPPGTVIARLYGHVGPLTLPTGVGALLASSTTRAASTLQTTHQWEAFTFDGTYTLVGGTPYVIVVEYTVGDASNDISIRRDGAGGHAGQLFTRVTSSGVWTNDAVIDAAFRVYTTGAASTVGFYDSPNLTDAAATTQRLGMVDDYTPATLSGTAIGAVVFAIGQTFMGSGAAIAAARFLLKNDTSATGNAVAKVYAHTGVFGTGGKPTGAALATSDPVAVNTIPTTNTVTNFPFSGANQIVLSNGTPYVVTVEFTGTPEFWVYASTSGTGAHQGNRVAFNGTTWVSYTSDAYFKVVPTTGVGSGTFTAGKVSEDGLVDDLGWAANNHTELLFSVTLKQADLANADTVRFRVLRNGATTGLTYTQVPTITILKGAPAGGKPKVWTGSSWTEKPVKVWTGSTWTEKPMKVWTGSSWVPV